MEPLLFKTLEKVRTGFPAQELQSSAVIALVAASMEAGNTPENALNNLASKCASLPDDSGLHRVADWIDDIDDAERECLLKAWPDENDEIDLAAIFDGLISNARYREPFIPISVAMGEALAAAINIPNNKSCTCVFSGSATIAWALAKDRPVTLFVGEPDVAMLVGLLAYADGRQLDVIRRNPMDGSRMPAAYTMMRPGHRSPLEPADYIVSVPPIGLRIREGAGSGLSFEAYQIEIFTPLAKCRFTSLVSDGLLFREARAEAALRERILADGKITVTSLPSGIFGRASGVQTALLTIDTQADGTASFVDGRRAEVGAGKSNEDVVITRLAAITSSPSVEVSVTELGSNGFNLLPSRYIHGDRLQSIREALSKGPVVKLSEIATVERPKAPVSLREVGTDAALNALEIMPSDIVNGYVSPPTREVAFDNAESERARKVIVRGGDIVVSIKGNVGMVASVGLYADIAEVEGKPWVVSQSLAIIRMVPGSKLRLDMLHSLMTAPWAREQMERLAAGSTVKSLSISDLRDLLLPMPSLKDQFAYLKRIEEMNKRRLEIARLNESLEMDRKALWAELWGIPAEEQEEHQNN